MDPNQYLNLNGLIWSGYLEKKTKHKEDWQQRWFELYSDTHTCTLLYFYEKGEKYSGGIVLRSTSTVIEGDNFGFHITCLNKIGLKKTLKVRALSSEIRHELITIIRDLIYQFPRSLICPNATQEIFTIPKRYVLTGKRIGSGQYGRMVTVTNGIDEKLNKEVDIQKIKLKNVFHDCCDAKEILRDLRFMTELNHPKIRNLYDLICSSNFEHFNHMYIVTTPIDTTLESFIRNETLITEHHFQWIMYQCLTGLKYAHSAGVIHRDLKPANILIDIKSHEIKLSDFGLWNNVDGDKPEKEVSNDVLNRWYRAPEVLLSCPSENSGRYGVCVTMNKTMVDLWSLGCVFGECLLKRPVLQGHCLVGQLEKIHAFVGTPSQEDLWFVTNKEALNFMMNVLPKKQGVDLKQKFPTASDQALSLLTGLLTFDPRKRLDANHAIDHPFLASVREVSHYEIDAGFTVHTDDIETMEITDSNVKQMMFQECMRYEKRMISVHHTPKPKSEPLIDDDDIKVFGRFYI